MKRFSVILFTFLFLFALISCNSEVKAPEVIYYTVTFDSAGGSEVKTSTVRAGDKVAKPADPTKKGFTFSAWYNGENKYDFSSAVNSNLTLTAKWEVNVYSVTYINLNSNATGSVPEKAMYPHNGTVTVKGNSGDLNETNNQWLEWNTKPNGKGISYSDGNQFIITENTTLYAIWKYNVIASSCTVESSYSEADFLTTDFKFDPRWFITSAADNKSFNNGICNFASLIDAGISEMVDISVKHFESGQKKKKNTDLFEALGFDDVKEYNMKSSDFTEDIHDVTRLILCHKEYDSDSLVILNIDASDISYSQWKSNIDVGADDSAFYSLEGSSHTMWTNKARHKGFAVTSERVKAITDKYIAEMCGSKKVSILVTGHSRGAAISNILGADYEDKANANFVPFTYAFATPNTTAESKSKVSGYKTIFNIINVDDIVTAVPTTTDKNGNTFTKYGTTKEVDFSKGTGAEKYRRMIGFEYEKANLSDWIKLIQNVCTSREDVYKKKQLSKSVPITLLSRWFDNKNLTKYYTANDTGLIVEMTEMAPALFYNIIPSLIESKEDLSSVLPLLAVFGTNLGSPYSDIVSALADGTINTKGVIFSHEPISYIVASHVLTD